MTRPSYKARALAAEAEVARLREMLEVAGGCTLRAEVTVPPSGEMRVVVTVAGYQRPEEVVAFEVAGLLIRHLEGLEWASEGGDDG